MEDKVILELETYNKIISEMNFLEEKLKDFKNMEDTFYKIGEAIFKSYNLLIIFTKEVEGYSYKINDLNKEESGINE